jgi:septal ring factor EnvC (AmiA/AmiB activator)
LVDDNLEFNDTRLDDVENKLADTEKEAEKARKDSKAARDNFNELKKQRFGSYFLPWPKKKDLMRLLDVISLIKPITTYPTASIRCTKN